MIMEVIIDRFEGEYAIVEIEIGKFAKISQSLLPNAKEGDVIKINIDSKATQKRSEKITSLVNNLFED